MERAVVQSNRVAEMVWETFVPLATVKLPGAVIDCFTPSIVTYSSLNPTGSATA